MGSRPPCRKDELVSMIYLTNSSDPKNAAEKQTSCANKQTQRYATLVQFQKSATKAKHQTQSWTQQGPKKYAKWNGFCWTSFWSGSGLVLIGFFLALFPLIPKTFMAPGSGMFFPTLHFTIRQFKGHHGTKKSHTLHPPLCKHKWWHLILCAIWTFVVWSTWVPQYRAGS